MFLVGVKIAPGRLRTSSDWREEGVFQLVL